MIRKQYPSREKIREHLEYDPDTGLFVRAKDVMKGQYRKIFAARKGDPAGFLHPDGYTYIKLDGIYYSAHRLAWIVCHGALTEVDIDHRDGDKSNNRIANLRNVEHKTNIQNVKKPQANNKTGFLGVSKHGDRFIAAIGSEGKTKHLGIFATPEEAHTVYIQAKRKLHEGCTI